MNDDTADLDRLFARLSGEGPHRGPDDHPAPEKLSAYQAKELSPEEDDALQEHLAHCTLCTELLLDLQRFLDPPPEDLPREGVVDFETAAEWRELRGRMGSQQGVVAQGSSRSGFLSFGSLRAWQSVAAVLALGVLALGGISLTLLKEKNDPEPNPILVELEAEGLTRSSSEERAELEGNKKPIALSLSLQPSQLHDYPSFAAEIEGKGRVHFVEGLHAHLEKVSLILHSERVEPGEVKITLWGIRDGKKNQVGVYRMTIVP